MGFDRVILSDLNEGIWTPLELCIPRDRHWAKDIAAVGAENPQTVGPALVESDIIRSRRPFVVQDVQNNPRVNQPIAMASRSVEYLAVPVVVGDEVGDLIHVDQYGGRAPFTRMQGAQMAVFAESLGLAFERAHLTEKLARVAEDLGSYSAGSADFGVRQAPERPTPSSSPDLLTPRENEVADLVAEGYTNGQIAASLFLSEATVKPHVKHILRKIDASHRAEAVAKLLRG